MRFRAWFDASRGTSIRSFTINEADYASLSALDLRTFSGDDFQKFIDTHTLYGDAIPHGFDHVIYPRDAGNEYYFSKSIFHMFLNQ